MVDAPTNLPVATAAITGPDRRWLVTDPWFRFFLSIWQRVQRLGTVSGWVTPSGTGSRATFNMDAVFPVSAGPTQAEVQAIAAQVVVLQKRLGQFIIDSKNSGVVS